MAEMLEKQSASVLERALAITRDTFRDTDAYPVTTANQNIAYSIYGLFHRQIALPLILGPQGEKVEGLSEKARLFPEWLKIPEGVPAGAKYSEGGSGTKVSRLLQQTVPFLYSVVSILYWVLRKTPRTAVWT